MSTPTRIYLAAVALIVLFWAGFSAIGPSRAAGFDHRYDSSDGFRGALHRSRDLGGYLAGRVDVGEGVIIPKEGLFVDVRASDQSGEVTVRRVAPVAKDGAFDVSGIPLGRARVSVELGSNEVIWESSDIVVGQAGAEGGELDPIDLRGAVFPFEVAFVGPDGHPATGGQFLWRPLASDSEEVLFGRPIDIRSGKASFLATGELIDVISLVPGASVEFFEGVRTGQVIHLGPGTAAKIQLTGDLPDRRDWRVYAVLVPLELNPELPVAKRAVGATEPSMFAEVDAAGEAYVAVARAGRYRLHWRIHQSARNTRRRSKRPVTFVHDENPITLGHAAGTVSVERRFPMERFAREVQGRR